MCQPSERAVWQVDSLSWSISSVSACCCAGGWLKLDYVNCLSLFLCRQIVRIGSCQLFEPVSLQADS